MTLLKIIGWVLLGILLLIIAALFIRVGILAEYSDKETSVVLTWLFLEIPLYPWPKKPKKKKENTEEKPEEPPEEEPEKTEEEKPEETPEEKPAEEKPAGKKKKKESFLHLLYRTNGIDGILLLLKRICSYTGTFLGSAMRGVVVDEFNLDVACVKKDDAAATAIYYGEVCAALFPLLGAVAAQCRMKKHDVNVYPDYLARFSSASFFVRLHITPMYFLGITVAYGCKMAFKVILRMFVKIFMPDKSKKAENSDIAKQ